MAVVSCGKIQNTLTIEDTGGPTTIFSLDIESRFCSTMCVVAYYETTCEGSSVIVSDYTCVDVEKKCSNDVCHKSIFPTVFGIYFLDHAEYKG